MNRNGLESAAWRCAAEGFNNILAMTGDYPTGGYQWPRQAGVRPRFGQPDPMLRSMNEGLAVSGAAASRRCCRKTDFFIGCAVSPFKQYERELMPQHFKLARKIGVGAQWVIPQLGYDMRKFHEMKLFLDTQRIKVPIIGNVYLLEQGRGQAVQQR